VQLSLICCLVWCRGQTRVGAEPQEFDWLVAGFVDVDVGVCREAVGTENIRLPCMLHAHLRADERETPAFNLTPDLFLAGKVRVRLA
jgi:hypothetical protein